MRVLNTLMASVSLVAVTGGAAAAQTTPPEESSSVELREIVVTAQRREERIQDVPLAVTAVDEVAIERLNARDIRDLTASVPNLVLNEVNIGPSMSQVSLRGVNSQDPEKSFDPAVGVFVDGVYLGTSAFNLLDAFDLQRIEILRGPQGTLFGRNTTGGAINAFRTQPTGELGGKARVIVGTANRLDVQGLVNFPIIEDVLAGKVSAIRQTDDGIYENTAGGATGARDRWAASATVRFTPNNRLEATLIYDHAEDDSELTPYAPRGVSFFSPIPVRVTQPSFPTSPATITPGFGPDAYCLAPGGRCEEMVSSITDPHFQESRLDALTLNTTYELSPQFTLDAVLGWRKSEEAVYIDFDGTDRTVFNSARFQQYEQRSAELRLTSDFSGPLNFVAGLFHFESEYALQQAIKLDLRMAGAPVPLGALYVNGSGDEDQHEAQTTAIFVQGDYEIMPTVTVTVGGRLTWDEKSIFTTFRGAPRAPTQAYSILEGVLPGRPITSQGGATVDFFEFTPKVAVNWKPSDDILLYASYSRGYNAGGFSARAGTVADVTTPFDPEYINAFEIGVKSDLLERRLRLNVAAFLNDYQDKQEEAIQPGPPPSFTSTTVRNVSGARIAGLEIEATALITEAFQVDFAFGYMAAEYTDFPGFLSAAQYVSNPPQPPGTLIAADFSALELRRTPEFTASLTPTYSVPVGDFGTLVLTGSARYTDVQYSEIFNNFRGKVPAQTVFDASASLEFGGPDQDRFRLTAFGKNLGDEQNFTSFTNSLVDFGVIQQPRTYGLELQARF
jgi:iron complex outermembrane receptor protein